MINDQGFSLTEILVSLMLISSALLTLMHQEWQLSQNLNQTLTHSQALVRNDNTKEKGYFNKVEAQAFFTQTQSLYSR